MNRCFQRAKEGDPHATAAVVEALRPRLVRMAAYYARRTHEDPDDLLQEAWLGLLAALSELNVNIGSPEHYLIRHARWRLLDAVKRSSVRRSVSLEDAPAALLSHAAPESPAAGVAAFADALPETPRAVLDCLLGGLTWREAGQTLGCSSANIAYHVRRIRRQYEEWSAEPV